MIRHAPSLGLGLGLSLRPFTFGSGGSGPIPGAVLDLSNFDFSFVEVPDVSGEGNNAILYSARGVSFAGSGYVELPDVGATKSITVLVRSSTDTTLYATDDETQTEDASAALVANDTLQEVTLTFASAISGKIRLGSDGLNSFSGELADAVCKDASGSTLDEFYLNEHTDTAAIGLDGLPCIGRNGNVGQYVGGAAVIQVPGDIGGLTPPQVLGLDFNRYSAITPTPVIDPDGDILVPKALTGSLDALGNPIEKPRDNNTFNADGSGYALVPDSGASSTFQTESLGILNEATWRFKGNFHGPAVSESEAMLGKWGPSSGARSFLFTRSGSNPDDNEIRIALSSNGTAVNRQDFQTIDADSLWVVRYDGPNGILKVERDGVELVSQDTVGAFPSSLHVSNIPFVICANGEEGEVINLSSRPISGIKIFNRYLTDEEVQSL